MREKQIEPGSVYPWLLRAWAFLKDAVQNSGLRSPLCMKLAASLALCTNRDPNSPQSEGCEHGSPRGGGRGVQRKPLAAPAPHTGQVSARWQVPPLASGDPSAGEKKVSPQRV